MVQLISPGLPVIVLAFAVAMSVTWISIPIVIKVASMRNLTDTPGHRKVHSRVVPTLGGAAIFIGFVFGFLLLVDGYMKGVNYLTVALVLLFFTGLKDDLITLDPKKRLAAEIIAVLILLIFTDIRITNFHGFIGITTIPIWLTYAITIFIVIVITNSFNLIDGIDGLAAATSIIASAFLGFWFWLSGNTGYSIMSAALCGSLVAYLRFNMSHGKNKIFMGDTGSLLVGFIVATLIICFNEVNAGSSSYHDLNSAPAISIAILIVPLFDTLRVFTIRAARGQHPFTADNRHIHHLLLRAGYSHRRSTFILSVSQILIIALAFSFDHIGILWLTVVLLSICIILTGVLFVLVYRRYLLKGTSVRSEDKLLIGLMITVHRRIKKKNIHIPVKVIAGVKSRALRPAMNHSLIQNPLPMAHLNFPKYVVKVEE